MSNRLLNVIYNVVRNYAWWVIVITLIVTIGAFVYTYHLSDFPMRSSFLQLLPQGDPILEEFQKREETLRQVDSLLILLSISNPAKFPEEERVKKLREEGEKIKQVLLNEKEISSVSYSSDLGLAGSELFINVEKLNRLKSYIDRINQLLKEPGLPLKEGVSLARVYADINEKIEASLSEKDRSKAMDPKSLSEQLRRLKDLNTRLENSLETLPQQMGKAQAEIDNLLKLMSDLGEETPPDPTQNLYLSEDKTSLLINVKPRFSSQRGLDYSKKITKLVKGEILNLSSSLQGIEVGLAGPYVTMAEANQAVKADMQKTTLISAVGIAILFLLIFRTLYPIVILIIPLMVGLIWTLAWAKFSVGGLNLITSFLPALLLGLGVDYGIHFLARYTEERRNGRYIDKALKKTMLYKGGATLSAAITTACVFLALMVARSRGLYELGIVGGVGILLIFISMVFILPSLIILSHRIFKRKFNIPSPERILNLKPLVRWALKRRKQVVVIILIATFFIFFQSIHIQFQFASDNLAPGNLESRETEEKLKNKFNLQSARTGETFIFFAQSKEDMERIVANLKENQMVSQVVSLESLLPDQLAGQTKFLQELELEKKVKEEMELIEKNLEDKEQITEQIRKLVKNLSSLQIIALFYGQKEVGKDLNNLVRQLNGLKSSFGQFNSSRLAQNLVDLKSRVSLLETRLRELAGSTPEPNSLEGLLQALPNSLKDKFLTAHREFIVYAYPNQDKLDQEGYYQKFVQSLSEISDNFIGMSMIEDRLKIHMKRDFWVTTILAGLAILAILWIRFRKSWSTFILALLPLIFGYLWMLGTMRMLGITFNFANIIISPLLVGIGVDNGIHLLHRYREEKNILRASRLAGVAIIATTLTTLLVFGSLIFAQTPGLKLLGQSALLGVGFTAIFSLFLLPPLVYLKKK